MVVWNKRLLPKGIESLLIKYTCLLPVTFLMFIVLLNTKHNVLLRSCDPHRGGFFHLSCHLFWLWVLSGRLELLGFTHSLLTVSKTLIENQKVKDPPRLHLDYKCCFQFVAPLLPTQTEAIQVSVFLILVTVLVLS
ncbi:hypothetical protein XENORESO_013825 [Xenotaenia resolanae]|uniref:Uncharacterized protein n=1 Tax=Xenotaenia resolanae TaxID=208358 RepID=A0ABV0WGP7_9TELE